MRTLALLLVCSALTQPALAQDRWTQFRGPTGQGHASATGLAVTWSETENVTWKTPIPGRGWSSPVVLGERIWLTTAIEQAASEEEREQKLAGNKFAKNLALAKALSLRAVCVDRRSGKLLQDIELFQVEEPHAIHLLNSYASPTPVLEEGRVYCHFGTYGTACLDTADGSILWKQQDVSLLHSVGPGSSPVVYGNLLVLACDGIDHQFVVALDKKTGKIAWKTDRPEMQGDDGEHHKAFSTPLVVSAGGRDQLVIPGAQWVVSYEPLTGKPIWQVNYAPGFSNVPRPVFGHDMIYICTGYLTPQLWAMRVDGQGDVTESHVVWKETKQIPDKPSPLLVGEWIFIVSGRGIVTCLDAKTGESIWRDRAPGNYSASPLYADGRIYLFSQEGKTTVIEPGDTFGKLAENQIDGRLMASPAVAGRAIFLRSDTHLYRIEKP